MSSPVLSVRNLTRHFGAIRAVDGVDLTLNHEEFLVLLGPAGAGKTTTLRLIAGLEVPSAGQVLIRGVDATAFEPKDRDVAMIFDSLALYPNKSGFENIASPLRIAGTDPAAVEARVTTLAETLQVSHILSRMPRTMSGGERQRIALGRALVRDPAFFLLDEPLSSLDAKLRIELRAELRRLQRDRGAAFLCATPDFAEAMAIADRVVVMIGGRVRQVAPPQTLYDAPADREVARFVGTPEINLLPAEFDPAASAVRVAGLHAAAIPALSSMFNGQRARFEAGLRPEQVIVEDANGQTPNGRIIDSEPLGLRTALTVETDGAQIRATVPERTAAALGVGAPVSVTLDMAGSLAFDLSDGRRIGPDANTQDIWGDCLQ